MEEKKVTFEEKLTQLLELAKTKKNVLDNKEILNYFHGEILSPEQLDQIYDFLENHHVDVLRMDDDEDMEPELFEDGEEEDSHLGDFIQDDHVQVPVDAATYTLLHEQLMEVLDTLTEREQKVLRLRFGLDDGRPRTLEEVGRQFNVTRERIRQIEAKALRKLRHPSRSKKLKDYLDE